ncbi:MAG TPA: diacylglycerol kinase family protein [Thermoleophilaceae bacterium]|nr:diacylglycerol kinase family protein [Thermoleophilaceae bacterium]
MARSRLAAVAALACGLVALIVGVDLAFSDFPDGLVQPLLLVVAAAAAWWGLLRRGARRALGLGLGGLAVAAVLVVAVVDDRLSAALVGLAAMVLGVAASRRAFAKRGDLPAAQAPARPVLLMNPKSGGGKAERFSLDDEARARGIEAVVMNRDDDLNELVSAAVERGADGLAMAGGDGSQAIVAARAAELGLPYACIPAGTRNHLALDLGVDRNDVVGALDAFVDGGEIVVDLAEVNGRVFVNNVSLGVYAEAVQQEAYRDAKVRTLVDTVPDALGPEAHAQALSWTDAETGEPATSPAMLVSNGRYRLGHAVGSGTRPTLQAGLLGVAVFATERNHRPHLPWREWGTPKFEVQADGPVYAGIDGEAAQLEPPLRFRSVPGVLRVRVAKQHPGASPSADMPKNMGAGAGALVRIALGR